jgi:Nucleotidyl transferase AbiEii toxin, Type IV TA system
MRYTDAAAFRQALEQRLKNEADSTGLGLARLRKRVAFELFLRRLLAVAPDRWVLKGALVLDFRLAVATRSTKDIDIGRDDDEQTAIRDITAAQQLALDDFFTFAATRTDELEDTDEFSAVRFHVTAQLAGRTFEQFLVDIGFSDTISWTPDTIHTSELLSFAGIGPPRACSRGSGEGRPLRVHPAPWRPPADASGRIGAVFLQILSGLAPGVATLAALHHHDRATCAYQQ